MRRARTAEALSALLLLLVHTLGELLDDLGAEGRQVVGVAAGDETVVGDYPGPSPLRMKVSSAFAPRSEGFQAQRTTSAPTAGTNS
jgi:hypothetical protein